MYKPDDFLIYTGEDGDAFHAMNLGVDGVIFVASHVNDDEMLTAIENSDIKKAAAIQRQFIPKVKALFSYPSPAPVKAVLNYLGFETDPIAFTNWYHAHQKMRNALSTLSLTVMLKLPKKQSQVFYVQIININIRILRKLNF